MSDLTSARYTAKTPELFQHGCVDVPMSDPEMDVPLKPAVALNGAGEAVIVPQYR
jgi:hypothetical protein